MADEYAIALGIFDGVHLGHKAVIGEALKYKSMGLKTGIFTFSAEDMRIKQGRELHYILDNNSKLDMLKSMGVDTILCPKFNDVKNMSGLEFAKDILSDRMHAKVVVCGQRFRFGKGATCDHNDLIDYGKTFGFTVKVMQSIASNGGIVSSSKIRTLLSEGNVKEANALLGYNYYINKLVVHGTQIGRTINVPTINQLFGERQVIAKFGVYRSITTIDGIEYPSMTNVGVKPTVTNEGVPVAETHIIGYSGDLYNRVVRVSLYDYVRPEHKFNSIEELKQAIYNDIAVCSCKQS